MARRIRKKTTKRKATKRKTTKPKTSAVTTPRQKSARRKATKTKATKRPAKKRARPGPVPDGDAGMAELRRRLEEHEIPPSASGRLKLATWNIRMFGARRRTDRSIRYIAEIVRQFDLVAIIEVTKDTKELERVRNELGPGWNVLASDVPRSASNKFGMAFLYNTAVVRSTNLVARLQPPGEATDEPGFSRPPFLCGFTTGTRRPPAVPFEFAAVAAHVRWGDGAIAERLSEQEQLSRALGIWKDENQDEYPHVFLMGTHQATTPEERDALTLSGLRIPTALDGVSGTNLNQDKTFDGILVFDETISLTTGRGGVVDFVQEDWESLFPDRSDRPSDTAQFTMALSDHLPLWVEVATGSVPYDAAVDVPQAWLAGYAADDPFGIDRLDFENEVNTLCALIMDDAWKPPLSIGLFGDWGTGKSFFIDMMNKRIKKLEHDSREADKRNLPTAFSTHVAQISFNAWHYIDANLWASLAVEIYEGISSKLFGKTWKQQQEESERERRDAALRELYQELETTRTRIERVQQTREAADRLEQRTKDELEQLRKDLESSSARLTRLTNLDTDLLREIFDADPELRTALTDVAKRMGGDDVVATYEEVQKVVAEMQTVGGRVKKVWSWFCTSRGSWWIAAVALVIPIGLALVLRSGVLERLVPQIITGVTAATTFITGLLTSLKPHLARAKGLLARAEGAQQLADKVARREETKLLQAICEQQTRKQDAERRLGAEQLRTEELQQQIADIERGRGLDYFLIDRVGSAEYQEQLGFIAIVRRDFDRLTERLNEGVEVEQADGTTEVVRIDRVVLYIDDLDRCPPDRVIDVLQAAHLLMAIPLFIVVVAVDPRWLLHSLRKYFARLLATGDSVPGMPEEEEGAWASTPQNYLEKIFQIPYTLPRMDADGYVQLVRSLTKPPESESKPEQIGSAGDSERESEQDTASPPEPEEGEGGGEEEESLPVSEEEEAEEPESESKPEDEQPVTKEEEADEEWKPTVDLTPAALDIKDWERKTLERLSPLISTPRSTKRLVNIYRLLRAGLDDDQLEVFVGTEQGGEHRAVQILLAMLIGFPNLAPDVFRGLTRTNAPTFTTFVEKELRPVPSKAGQGNAYRSNLNRGEVARWNRLCDALLEAHAQLEMGNSLRPFVKWRNRVARYSFRAGHILSALGEDTASGPA